MIQRTEQRVLEEAFMNPIFIMEDVLKLDMDGSSSFKVLKEMFSDIISTLYNYDDGDSKIIKGILERHGINIENIVKEVDNREDLFGICLDDVIDDVLEFMVGRTSRAGQEGSDTYLMYMDIRKFIEAYDYQEENFMINLCSERPDLPESTCKLYAKNITRMIGWIVSELRESVHDIDTNRKQNKKKNKNNKKRSNNEMKKNKEYKEEVKEVKKEVNNLDEEQGVDLKEAAKQADIDAEYLYWERNTKYKANLSSLILFLNDMDERLYISNDDIYGLRVDRIKINKAFKNIASCYDDKSYNIHSLKYKARYLTEMITWICDYLDDMVNITYHIKGSLEFIEYEAKMGYLDYIYDCALNLIGDMMSKGDLYSCDSLGFFRNMSILINSYYENKNVESTLDKIDIIENHSLDLSLRLKRFSKAPNDVSMDTIIKLAYLVSVNKLKLNKKANLTFIEGYKFNDKNLTKEWIENLGRAIINDKSGKNELFVKFMKADPLLWSKWKDETYNDELSVGIASLYYLSFITYNKNITRVIDRVCSK